MNLCYRSIPPSLTDLATFACISQNMCSLITLLKALENLTEGSTMRVGGAPLFPECSHSLGRCQAAAHWGPSTGNTCEELHMHKSVMSKHVWFPWNREENYLTPTHHHLFHSIQSQPHSPPPSFTTSFHYILPPYYRWIHTEAVAGVYTCTISTYMYMYVLVSGTKVCTYLQLQKSISFSSSSLTLPSW